MWDPGGTAGLLGPSKGDLQESLKIKVQGLGFKATLRDPEASDGLWLSCWLLLGGCGIL